MRACAYIYVRLLAYLCACVCVCVRARAGNQNVCGRPPASSRPCVASMFARMPQRTADPFRSGFVSAHETCARVCLMRVHEYAKQA